MKIFTTSKARILFVSVPEDSAAHYVKDNVMYYSSDWRTNELNQGMGLPDGQWQFLSLLKDADEEKAASVVDKWDSGKYNDYSRHLARVDTALESIHSLANHLGCEGNQVILVENLKHT